MFGNSCARSTRCLFAALISTRGAASAAAATASRSESGMQNTRKYVPRRALLYVPASNQKMLKKVPQIKADCIVLELEDGVALSAKAEARRNVRDYLDTLEEKGSHQCYELGVRVNSVASGLMHEDIKEVSAAKNIPDAFMVPKVDSVDDLSVICGAFRAAYGDQRIRNSRTRLVIWVESARALLGMQHILETAVNMAKSGDMFPVDAVVFGSDDYCADIGATRTLDASENVFARQHFVACCKAFGLQAIDSVYIDIKDTEGLRKQCEQGRNWGFDGKQTIHPSQIDIVQNGFLPSEEKVQWARGLMKEYEEHQKAGKGAFTYRGHMIDRPLLLQAQNIVTFMERISGGHC